MRETAYWIVMSCGFDPTKERQRQWDALVVSVMPQDTADEPDLAELSRKRPGRVVVLGVWAAGTGWVAAATHGPPRLCERFSAVAWDCQGQTRAAIKLGIEMAMRLCLGLPPTDREPFPAPGVN